MYQQLSPNGSEYVFGIDYVGIDPVDLHFLKTSGVLDLQDVSRLFCHVLDRRDDHDFSLVKEFGPLRIGVLRISDNYVEYFKETNFARFEDSIVFYAPAMLPASDRCLIWPLMSEYLYMVRPEMVDCEPDFSSFFASTVELDCKTDETSRDGKAYVQSMSFLREYHTGKRKFFTRAIKNVFAVCDIIMYEGWYRDNPSERYLLKRRVEAPMWFVRHKDEAGFIKVEELSQGTSTDASKA